MAVVLQAASREALASAGARLDAFADKAKVDVLVQVGEELFAIAELLVAQKALRRLLGDPAADESARVALAQQVLGSKVSKPTFEQLTGLLRARWSRSLDLVDGVESLARQATLAAAEKNGKLDDVEDELFRFGRILDREPQLNGLLADTATPVGGRTALLDQVLGGKVSTTTATLLRQTVRLPRGRHLDVIAEELAELAAARRDRSVAKVRTAVALTSEQEQKLVDKLTRLYGRAISLQVELDERLLGGLVVQVGDEVIDGSVAGKLAAARRTLPS
ncbi:F0F1 ATP synthase subunit delta [Pseudonocardia sp. TRM90224]|uniref:F0F1 ATP synthase subunit delta n=1 Tax=Pseudonocardia sp. TRM90224 TaxID=2812678 RepID=UPI001E545AEA|nr:F0F1 ATP synthase subunit delta [Pseudonocardia sp. TRM90224]